MANMGSCSQCGAQFELELTGDTPPCPKCGGEIAFAVEAELVDDGALEIPEADLVADLASPFEQDAFLDNGNQGFDDLSNLDVGESDLGALDLSDLPPVVPTAIPVAPSPLAASPERAPQPTNKKRAAKSPSKSHVSKTKATPEKASEPGKKAGTPVALIAGCGIAATLLLGVSVWFLFLRNGSDQASQPLDLAAAASSEDSSGQGNTDDPLPSGSPENTAVSAVSQGGTHYPWDPSEQANAYDEIKSRDDSSQIVTIDDPDIQSKIDQLGSQIARVHVKTKTIGSGNVTGTSGYGILISSGDNQGVVLTTSSVGAPNQYRPSSVEVSLGTGRTTRRVVEAGVYQADHLVDLAKVNLKDPNLPECQLDLSQPIELTEGQQVYVLSVPSRPVIAGQPEKGLRLLAATISEVTKEGGDEPRVKIKAGIHSDNTGSVVVTTEGEFAGILGHTPNRTSYEGECNLITRATIQRLMDGKLNTPKIIRDARFKNGGKYSVELMVFDPGNRFGETSVVAYRASEDNVMAPDTNGRWSAAGTKPLIEQRLLRRRMNRAEKGAVLPLNQGNFTVSVPEDEVVIQIVSRSENREPVYGKPILLTSIAKNKQPSAAGDQSGRAPDGSKTATNKIGEESGFAWFPAPYELQSCVFRPDTGEVICLPSIQARETDAYIMPPDFFTTGDMSNCSVVPLPSTPLVATHKNFQGTNYWCFAVRNEQMIHVYNIDNGRWEEPIPFSAVPEGRSFTGLTASQNPNDPYVYGWHHRGMGAISLREMKDCGIVTNKRFNTDIRDVFDLKIHPNGESLFVASYRNWSQYSLATPSTGDTPVMGEWPIGASMPRDFRAMDRYAAFAIGGTWLFNIRNNRSSTLRIGSPAVILNRSPLTIYHERNEIFAKKLDFDSPATQTVFNQKLPVNSRSSTARSPVSAFNKGDFITLFADEEHDRLILVFENVFAVRKLSGLDLSEPLPPRLMLTDYQYSAPVGKETVFDIKPTDSNVSVEFDSLPSFVTQNSNGLACKPSSAEIGQYKIPVSLTLGETRVASEVELEVIRPSLDLPFTAHGFRISPTGTFAVAWRINERGYKEMNESSTLALVPMKRGPAPKLVDIPYRIADVGLSGANAIVQSTPYQMQAEVYSLREMQRVKTLLAGSEIAEISTEGKSILLKGRTTIDTYNASTLERKRTVDIPDIGRATSSRSYSQGGIPRDGKITPAGLTDSTTGKLTLALTSNGMPTVGVPYQRSGGHSFLRYLQPPRDKNKSQGTLQLGPEVVGEKGWQVVLWATQNWIDPESTRSRTLRRTASLSVISPTGEDLGTQELFSKFASDKMPQMSQEFAPKMQVLGNQIFFAYSGKLYRWTTNECRGTPIQDKDAKLYFIPRQSTLVIKSRNQELKHRLGNAHGSVDYFLMTRSPWLTLDEETGAIRVDRDKMVEGAASILTGILRRVRPPNDAMSALKEYSQRFSNAFEESTGTRLKGIPIGTHVYLKATDSKGEVAEIGYYVFADVSFKEVLKLNASNQ